MKVALAPLPYENDALAPYISPKALQNHYEHHRTDLEMLRQAVERTSRARGTLEQLICETDGTVCNLAAQVWNHTFYFDGMRKGGGGRPAWLALDRRRRLHVVATRDAETPLRQGFIPLLAIDVWEHAYYLDYRNDRETYVGKVLDHLVDWTTVARRLAACQPAPTKALAKVLILPVAALRGGGSKTTEESCLRSKPSRPR
jgi:Fe-Mn family superoxide dismutase